MEDGARPETFNTPAIVVEPESESDEPVALVNVKLVEKRLPAVSAVVVTFWKMLVSAEPTFKGPAIVVEPVLDMVRSVVVAHWLVDDAIVSNMLPTGVVVGVARKDTSEVGATSPMPTLPVKYAVAVVVELPLM